MRSSRPLSWVLLAALTLLGAAGCHTATTKRGELGDGVFDYECVGTTDAFCPNDEVSPAQFPKVLAVGGQFKLGYRDVDAGSGSNEFPEQASASFVAGSSGGVFQVLREGEIAFVGHTTISGETAVSDYLYFTLVQTRKLVVTQVDGTPAPAQVKAGTVLTLRVTPRDDGGRLLAGALPYRWTIQDPTVLSATLGADDTIQVTAGAPGTGHLLVEIDGQGVTGDVAVEVTP